MTPVLPSLVSSRWWAVCRSGRGRTGLCSNLTTFEGNTSVCILWTSLYHAAKRWYFHSLPLRIFVRRWEAIRKRKQKRCESCACFVCVNGLYYCFPVLMNKIDFEEHFMRILLPLLLVPARPVDGEGSTTNCPHCFTDRGWYQPSISSWEPGTTPNQKKSQGGGSRKRSLFPRRGR